MSFLTAIATALKEFFEKIVALVAAIFTSIWDLLTDFLIYCFDKMMGLAVTIVGSLDLSSITNVAASAFGSVPPEVSNVMGLLGIGDCMAVIVSAILIKIILQLVPFTRLGS